MCSSQFTASNWNTRLPNKVLPSRFWQERKSFETRFSSLCRLFAKIYPIPPDQLQTQTYLIYAFIHKVSQHHSNNVCSHGLATYSFIAILKISGVRGWWLWKSPAISSDKLTVCYRKCPIEIVGLPRLSHQTCWFPNFPIFFCKRLPEGNYVLAKKNSYIYHYYQPLSWTTGHHRNHQL